MKRRPSTESEPMATSSRNRSRTRSASGPRASIRQPGAGTRRPGGRPTTPRRSSVVLTQMIIAGAAALVIVLVIVAFNLIGIGDQPQGPRAGCVVAIDPQGTTAAMADEYRSWLPGEIASCAKADRADVDLVLVTSETRTGTTTPVSADLAGLDFSGNEHNDGLLIDQKIEAIVDEADSAIFGAPEQKYLGTDLIGLICVSSDLLEGRDKKTLIVNTDAMNDRAPYVLRFMDFAQRSIQRYVDELVSTGQVCDLTGTSVYFYGAGIGDLTENLSAEHLAGIETFWHKLFEAAGATIVEYKRNPQ